MCFLSSTKLKQLIILAEDIIGPVYSSSTTEWDAFNWNVAVTVGVNFS